MYAPIANINNTCFSLTGDRGPNSVDLHPLKALFSLDSGNLQQHRFLGLGSNIILLVLLSSRPTRYMALQIGQVAPPN